MYKFCFVCTVLNREKDIKKFLESMLEQDYDNNNYAIAVVDNGSTDKTLELISEYTHNNNLIVIDGSLVKGSPYSARNMVINSVDADNYCFMDGYPERNYLKKANQIELDNSIVAGRIIIETSDSSSVYELYDSVFNLDNEKIINKFQRAPTGNLIINRKVFQKLGLFDEKIRSGGDMIYTSNATRCGFKISYDSQLISKYYARNKIQLLKKMKRVAKGQVGIWQSEKKVFFYLSKSIIKLILPNNPVLTFKYIDSRLKQDKCIRTKFFIMCIHEYIRMVMAYTNIVEFISKRRA
ncbi:glycosyltransferase [Vibrio alginolyticus]|uniref:glycosyltransferase n=1 Tax=Vibrio alginolyticus TaxID=663 RepID=UPI0021D0C400